jgi:hypothetical protein
MADSDVMQDPGGVGVPSAWDGADDVFLCVAATSRSSKNKISYFHTNARGEADAEAARALAALCLDHAPEHHRWHHHTVAGARTFAFLSADDGRTYCAAADPTPGGAQEARARRGGAPRFAAVRAGAAGGGCRWWELQHGRGGASRSLAARGGAVHAAGAGLPSRCRGRERRGARAGGSTTSLRARGGERAAEAVILVAPCGDRDRRGRGGVPGAVRRVDGGVQRFQVSHAMSSRRWLRCDCEFVITVKHDLFQCSVHKYHSSLSLFSSSSSFECDSSS